MSRITMPPTAAAFAAALLLAAATPAAAQFAAVVPPPVRPAPVEVVNGDTVPVSPVDSAQMATRMDLRAWVDSAALALTLGSDTAASVSRPVGADETVADSTVRVTAPLPLTPDEPQAPPPDGPVSGGSVLRDGAPAPDTATPLPLLGVLGSAMTLAGLALRRRRR